MPLSEKIISEMNRNVAKWRDGSEGEIPKEWLQGLLFDLQSAQQALATAAEEKAILIDLHSRKYDVMSWFIEDGWLALMKQDTSLVQVKVDMETVTPVGPSEGSSRVVADQRCLLVPANHLTKLQAIIDKLSKTARRDALEEGYQFLNHLTCGCLFDNHTSHCEQNTIDDVALWFLKHFSLTAKPAQPPSDIRSP